MRYLGLDLGTTTLGISITDKTNTISTPLKVIKFPKEDYLSVLKELETIITDNNITDIVLGLPKNMDNSLGFAAQRSIEFKKLLEVFPVNIHLYDERLTTIEAMNILKSTGNKNIKQKNIIDAISANIILDSYLRSQRGINEK